MANGKENEMKCRLCGETDLQLVIDLGKLPLSNSFLVSPHDPEELYPLRLVFCPECSLVQISETVPPEKLFSHYNYFSSMSQTMGAHAKDLVGKTIASRKLDEHSRVVELASNDGYLLQYFQQAGITNVLGIDPARNVAQVAIDKGVPTLCEFFNEQLAETLPKADVILALNVLGHVPDLNGFVRGIQKMLKSNGMAIVEVPYIRNLVECCEPDTVYFEHFSYFSLTSLINLFKWNGLIVARAKKIDIHGGSLRLWITHPTPFPPHDRYGVEGLREREVQLGVNRIEYYRWFPVQVDEMLRALKAKLLALKAQGKQIIAYGAAAKGVQLLNYLKMDSSVIDYVVDSTPAKIGRYLPGSRIKIVPPEQFGNPDCVLLTAWNFSAEIESKHPEFRGEWIMPNEKLQPTMEYA